MSDYLERKVKPIRRAIVLTFLERCADYTSNADIILHVINGTPDGITVFYGDVIEDLRWLEAKGLVRLSGDDTVIAEATMAGVRIARGENYDPGVARQSPRG